MLVNENNKIKVTIISLACVVVLSIGGMSYFYFQSVKKHNEPVEKVLRDYEELEKSYGKAVKELESVATNEYDNIGILKQNLKAILVEIKHKKEELDKNRGFTGSKSETGKEQAKDYKDRLEMSKQVADAFLLSRLESVEKENKNLQQANQTLTDQNEKLETNLKFMQDKIDDEKSKNANLKQVIEVVNKKIEVLESSKKTATPSQELLEMKRKKEEFERQLAISNKTIEVQNKQINTFVTTLRRVNVNCFYTFEKGNKEKETRIYLTSNGISKQYQQYFIKNKPNIELELELNKELFDEGAEKVEIKIYDSKDIEIFSTAKTISSSKLMLSVSGKIFNEGTYSIAVRKGDEDLVIGGKYFLKL